MTIKFKIVIKKFSWHLLVYLAIVFGSPHAAGSRTEGQTPESRIERSRAESSAHQKPVVSHPKVAKQRRKVKVGARCYRTRSWR